MRRMSVERAIELVQRDHGGCDQNTCTLGVALRNGFNLIAIDHWIGSGAASKEFNNTELDYTPAMLQKECAVMTRELDHIQCPHCNAVLWLPDETGYHCDSCARDITETA